VHPSLIRHLTRRPLAFAKKISFLDIFDRFLRLALARNLSVQNQRPSSSSEPMDDSNFPRSVRYFLGDSEHDAAAKQERTMTSDEGRAW
jgi:hypothetical protein